MVLRVWPAGARPLRLGVRRCRRRASEPRHSHVSPCRRRRCAAVPGDQHFPAGDDDDDDRRRPAITGLATAVRDGGGQEEHGAGQHLQRSTRAERHGTEGPRALTLRGGVAVARDRGRRRGILAWIALCEAGGVWQLGLLAFLAVARYRSRIYSRRPTWPCRLPLRALALVVAGSLPRARNDAGGGVEVPPVPHCDGG